MADSNTEAASLTDENDATCTCGHRRAQHHLERFCCAPVSPSRTCACGVFEASRAATAESLALDALLAELADEHGCDVEDESTGRLSACRRCAERATRLAARLAHERLIFPPGGESDG